MTVPEEAVTPSGNPASILWRRFLTQGLWDVLLWVTAAATWLFLMIRTGGNLLEISVWSVPFLLLITAGSTPWRTIRWRTVLGFFMFGMGPVFLAAAFTGWALDAAGLEGALQRWLLGTNLRLEASADIIAPISEELLKVLPLLIFVWWRKGGLRTSGGPLDFAVLAGATGAGLAFAEDIFVYLSQGVLNAPPNSSFGLGLGRLYAGAVGAEPGGFVFTGRSDFADNASFFFPEMQELLGVVWAGHGALALAIGLSIGLAVWWSRTRGSKVFYLIPVATFVWAVWEHLMANWYGGSGCAGGTSSLLCTLAAVDLHGRVLPMLVLAGWAYAAWISGRVLRAHRREDPMLQCPWSEVRTKAYRAGWPALIKDRFDFLRWRRKVGYGAFHLESSKQPTQRQVLSLMASRVKALALRERLEATGPTRLSEPASAAVEWLAPAP